MPPRSLPGSVERALVRSWYAPRPTALSSALLPLAGVTGAVVAVRRALRRAGIGRATRLAAPVVVVGNITVGGTGKTPLVRHLAAGLRAAGWQPGVVSRGHGRTAGEAEPRLVAEGDSAAEAGDEPLLYAADGLPVAVGRDRVAAARLLLAGHPDVNVLLADDGLQHYRLARAVEIAVVDGERGFGNGWLLPAGPLREPRSRLREVDAVVVNGGPPAAGMLARGSPAAGALAQRSREVVTLGRDGREAGTLAGNGGEAGAPPTFAMRLVPGALRSVAEPSLRADVERFRGAPVRAVAGIGHPERFFAMLRALGFEVRGEPFPDHHRFVAADLAGGGDAAILMTEKDAVKCRAFADARMWAVPVEAMLEPPLVPLVEERLRGS